MRAENRMFAAKLQELERQAAASAGRMQLDGEADHAGLRRELERARREYRAQERLLRRSAAESRCPAAAALAQAQLEYDRRIRSILQEQTPGPGTDPAEDRVEAAGLYGEYAMDFAAQAVRHARIAVLTAMDLEMTRLEREEAALYGTQMEENAHE